MLRDTFYCLMLCGLLGSGVADATWSPRKQVNYKRVYPEGNEALSREKERRFHAERKGLEKTTTMKALKLPRILFKTPRLGQKKRSVPVSKKKSQKLRKAPVRTKWGNPFAKTKTAVTKKMKAAEPQVVKAKSFPLPRLWHKKRTASAVKNKEATARKTSRRVRWINPFKKSKVSVTENNKGEETVAAKALSFQAPRLGMRIIGTTDSKPHRETKMIKPTPRVTSIFRISKAQLRRHFAGMTRVSRRVPEVGIEIGRSKDRKLWSELNPGVDLDMELGWAMLNTRVRLLRDLDFKLGLGAVKGNFGYDKQSYIFKTGPNFTVKSGLAYRIQFKRTYLIIAVNYWRHFLEGDEFENRVDTRQGEPVVSKMDTELKEVSVVAHGRRFIVNSRHKFRPFYGGAMSDLKIDMSIGWRINDHELMRHTRNFGMIFGMQYQYDRNKFHHLENNFEARVGKETSLIYRGNWEF